MSLDLRKKMNPLTSSLLVRGNDESMLEDSLALAKELLHTQNLYVHPDFLLISASGKRVIGVEDVLPIIKKGAYPPVVAPKTVIVIDGMEKLTVAAQNKLLVLLEENPYCFVIGIARQNALLDTLKSRMRIVEYHSLGKAEFLNKYSLSADEDFFYYISDGQASCFQEVYKEREMFMALRAACMNKTRRKDILPILHMLKEKDKLAVTENKTLVKAVLLAMSSFFVSVGCNQHEAGNEYGVKKCMELCYRLLDDAASCMESSYTKDDFFRTIILCVELEEDKTNGII